MRACTSAMALSLALPGRGDLRLLVARVRVEGAGRRELAELVADHVLGDEHRDELPPVVDRERVAEQVGDHRRPPRPGLDDLLLARRVGRLDLPREARLDVRPLLEGARHAYFLLFTM